MSDEVKLLPCPPFQIGDEVAVIPDCADWASDWLDVRLWVAGLQAVPGGGFDYWVSDEWPLPERTALTDCFYMDVNGKPNMLALVATRPPIGADEVVEPSDARQCPSGYTPETWAAKQAEVAEFSRRDPFKDPTGERRANSEARLRAAMCIQCGDVPDQFALVRRGDLITLLGDFTRYRAGFEIWREERAKRAAMKDAASD